MSKALVIDDDAIIARLFSFVLSKLGYREVVTMGTEMEALHFLGQVDPSSLDLVVTDQSLESSDRKSGYIISQRLRDIGYFGPIIISTGNGLGSGANGDCRYDTAKPNLRISILDKPFQVEDVRRLVTSLQTEFSFQI